MANTTKIQWTDATWNPWHGCKKVSPGCKYCYMYRDKERYGHDPTAVLRSKTKFNEPLKWKEPRLVFPCSWSDFFIENADAWRDEAWKIIKNTPHLTYQILTKRPERILECLPDDWGEGYPNVWLGTSIETQDQLHRMNTLCEVPAKVRFLSLEPLIGEVSLASEETILYRNNIHWVIVGGESGNDTGKYRYRECKIIWIEAVVRLCSILEVPVFVKQLGTHLSKKMGLSDRHGGNIDEFPKFLQIRQMP